ncbi:divergent AAA domain protein [Olsenella sp. DNF00959]|nr:divergent AAA domain protein [Olsenella sp. DNF00959]
MSAFANYEGGSILFGVDDAARVVGLGNVRAACLDIENKVNDSISPRPDYELLPNTKDSTVELVVRPGRSKPYLYRAKAYRRSDSSTVEVDPIEFRRLVLEGSNLSYERLSSRSQQFTFETLGSALKSTVGIKNFDTDTLRTLELYSDEDGYNNAAALLADKNDLPGFDMAQFGESISVILRRETSAGKSVLLEYEDAVRMYRDCYCYERISGFERTQVERIPSEAFREAIANALVHRTWDVPAHARIAMYPDRVEVSSPGGLPTGISEEEYLAGMVSIRRNPVLANVFYRLGLIEAFGTGVQRIRDAYASSKTTPRFLVTENTITVILPVTVADLGLTDDQRLVYGLLSPTVPRSSGELLGMVDFGRSKLSRILKDLIELGQVFTVGAGRGLKYKGAIETVLLVSLSRKPLVDG